MSLVGRIHEGAVVFEQPVPLAEGTRVRVEPMSNAVQIPADAASLLEKLGDVVGAIDDLPADLAAQHDHYLYGAPKRP